MHPTVKPVALVIDAIRDCSRRGDIVLDSFGGSGTTLIACEKAGRKARLIELDPTYCDQIVRRWQKLMRKGGARDHRQALRKTKSSTGMYAMKRVRSRQDKDDQDRAYAIGYGKPPATSRFKPGQSGNAKAGRKATKTELVDHEQMTARHRNQKRDRAVGRSVSLKELCCVSCKAPSRVMIDQQWQL